MKRYLIFDVETTGLKVNGYDRMIQLGYVLWTDAGDGIAAYEEYSHYFNPLMTSSPGAFKVHQINDEKLREYLPIGCRDGRLSDFLKAVNEVDILIAHHKSFDISFIAKELEYSGFHCQTSFYEMLNEKCLCTAELGYRLLKSQSLDTLLKALDISTEGTNRANYHDAMEDAKLTTLAYKKLKQIYPDLIQKEEDKLLSLRTN